MFGNSLTLFSFASVAAAGLASGAAISARQTPATCETFSFASLAVRPKGSSGTSQATWAGVIPGVTHDGINGKQASILVTKDDNGNALKPQIWEFARCTSLDNHPSTSGRPETYFGIVRPQNATQHCLAVESTSDADPGDRNSVLDSSCTQIPEQYRTWFFHSIAASQATQYLEFANQDMTIVISDTKHAELQFLTNGAKAGQTELEMVLIDSRL